MVEKQLVEIEVREKVMYASYKAFDEYGNIIIEKCNFFFNNIQNIKNLDAWIHKQDVNNGKSLIIETVETKSNVNEWIKFLMFNVKCFNTLFIKTI